MKKLNSVIYNKLFAQAEEAKTQGFNKLASNILAAIGPHANEEESSYSYKEMQEDIHRDLWKIATRILHYYDVESANAEKIDEELSVWASKLTEGLEQAINVDSLVFGALEPKVLGEK